MSSDKIPICACENVDQAKSLANFLWNEKERHMEDVMKIILDLMDIKQKWGVSPSGERKFVIP